MYIRYSPQILSILSSPLLRSFSHSLSVSKYCTRKVQYKLCYDGFSLKIHNKKDNFSYMSCHVMSCHAIFLTCHVNIQVILLSSSLYLLTKVQFTLKKRQEIFAYTRMNLYQRSSSADLTANFKYVYSGVHQLPITTSLFFFISY